MFGVVEVAVVVVTAADKRKLLESDKRKQNKTKQCVVIEYSLEVDEWRVPFFLTVHDAFSFSFFYRFPFVPPSLFSCSRPHLLLLLFITFPAACLSLFHTLNFVFLMFPASFGLFSYPLLLFLYPFSLPFPFFFYCPSTYFSFPFPHS